MKYISSLVMIIGLSSCVKKPMPDPICKTVFKATTAAAVVVASVLECQNVGAIAADLSEPVIKMNLCSESKAQTTLSDFICPQLATFATSFVSASIPSSWQCTPTTINDMLKREIITRCAIIIK